MNPDISLLPRIMLLHASHLIHTHFYHLILTSDFIREFLYIYAIFFYMIFPHRPVIQSHMEVISYDYLISLNQSTGHMLVKIILMMMLTMYVPIGSYGGQCGV